MKRKGFKEILLLFSMLFALTGCSVSEATQHGMAVDTIQTEDVLLRVDFLNVGQADCALLSTNGHYMVIDGGNNGDADTILSYLEGQGVEKLDAVVGTHPHEDHIGSLDAIINHFDVDAVYMPKIMHTSKTFEDVLDAVANKGLKIKSPIHWDTIDINGLEIEVLGPKRSKISSSGGRSPAAAAKHWCRDLPYRFAGEYCLHHRREKYCLQLQQRQRHRGLCRCGKKQHPCGGGCLYREQEIEEISSGKLCLLAG